MAMLPLLIVMILLSALLSAVFVAAWATMGRPRHALTWSACFALGTVQWILNMISVMFDASPPGAWIIATLCGSGLIALAVIGYRQRSGLSPETGPLAAFVGVEMAAAAVFRVFWPHAGFYLMLVPLSGLVLLPFAIHAIAVRPGLRSMGEKVAMATIGLLILFEIVIFLLALRVGATVPDPAYDIYMATLLTGLPTLYIATGISGLFLLMADQTVVLQGLARRDTLTGLLNRRGFRDAVERLLTSPGAGCVVLGDIDHFKGINDRFGHAAGDLALKQVGRALRLGARDDDVVARIGGEEFALFVPGSSLERVQPFIERLRAAVANVALPGHPGLGVTMSFGIAQCGGSIEGLDAVMSRADEALYRAKTAGRDRVMSAMGERTARRTASELEAARQRAVGGVPGLR
ncbi:GGDEF domain-containing protein [Sphingosinicella sp. LHD-64]|uniref:GGDEF domain-containing protein n=1 Tax=Sphingosinicella sp. LHD-64 TaxID=3072139 RepID=UPI00280D8DF9|nr:GGDEF domain-containing protein [Sphingosinicella sp. LHD-64]MDQ8756636.1 GGDEF domain-containing protein [Sphingosinicella sp. LHD-64]